jgi:2-polyprenyl-6-methoxyphenol hydroxylase-like FAD-dependent oxidoreductase
LSGINQLPPDSIANEESDYNPEIDRKQLRGIFLEVLGDHVKWDSFVNSVKPNSEGHGYQVGLQDGSSHIFDLVIGADGCFSHIRPLLTDIQPVYTGVTFIETYISDAATKYPVRYELVGRGMMMVPAAAGQGKGIIGQQNSDGKLRVYAVLRVPEDWSQTNGYPWEKDWATTRKLILENYPQSNGWKEDFLDLFRVSDDIFRPWPIYALPVGHKWEHKTGFTLIGDAAHVMSPFAGEGANIAMLDGAQLGQAIVDAVKNGTELDDGIRVFEEVMLERAKGCAAESHHNLVQFTDPAGDFVGVAKQWEKEIEKHQEK